MLCAHPDLAGRLALSQGLTADSTGEQAAAGLDRLSPAELERFTALNARYRDRFGIPFIMAVKGRTKQEIVTRSNTASTIPEQEFALRSSKSSASHCYASRIVFPMSGPGGLPAVSEMIERRRIGPGRR